MNLKLNCPEGAKFMIATETKTKREHGIFIELKAYSSKKAHTSYGMLPIPTNEYESIFPDIKHQLDLLKKLNSYRTCSFFKKYMFAIGT